MIISNKKKFKLSFFFLNFIGSNTFLFFWIYPLVLPKNHNLLVKSNTNIVIEGFPRSANTFSVVALNYANSNNLKIAHHTHSPAQVIKGIRLGIPVLILVRNPRDAIASLLIREPLISLTQAINSYVNFYQSIYEHNQKFVIASFEEIINDYHSSIKKINNKFSTNFIAITPQNKELKEIFKQIESFEDKETKRARPSLEKNKFKNKIFTEIDSEKYTKKMALANSIYYKFCNLD